MNRENEPNIDPHEQFQVSTDFTTYIKVLVVVYSFESFIEVVVCCFKPVCIKM